MCISYPGRVVAVDGPDAVVDTAGRRRRASTLLLPDIAVGEFDIVGAGSILRRLDAAEATTLTRALDAAIATTARRTTADPGGRP
jgi:hydrogenase assembly chaperone HypC/HupF